jgi:hypothetical protein
MIQPGEMEGCNSISIEVHHIPPGHVVVGYVAQLKVLDKDGEEYWATRDEGLGDMEMLGMAHDMVDGYQNNIRSMRKNID